MEKFKEIIRRIKELAYSFINPIPPEPTFKELALAADLDQAALAELEKTMGGVNWNFSEEIEEVKKGTSKKISNKEIQLGANTKNIVNPRNVGEER